MYFDKKYFQKVNFSREDIAQYFENALRDLDIAVKDKIPEVKFTYAYQALIKGGIALIAKAGNVKVRSSPGHHIKILEKIREILNDEKILVIGNVMRMKRNLDFYSGGEVISEKEAKEYLEFVQAVIKKIKKSPV